MSHAQIGRREEVDSRLLVVGSQIGSLTPGPSFAHNLGCRCPNCQCEAIFDIYVSRPFQWHQEHPNARCFSPCCRALNIRESRKTPNLQLFQVLGFTPTFGQSGVATLGLYYMLRSSFKHSTSTYISIYNLIICKPLILLDELFSLPKENSKLPYITFDLPWVELKSFLGEFLAFPKESWKHSQGTFGFR